MGPGENTILFGKYQLRRVIGTGRTCTVYLAVHLGLKEYRAIKKNLQTLRRLWGISKGSSYSEEYQASWNTCDI
ncbi:hypothetical protein DXA13_02570 [Clostridium sp. AM58-1XD]|nr:hypothetical protein DXA13_02570 [Clostridium sp. AM58-1XD]